LKVLRRRKKSPLRSKPKINKKKIKKSASIRGKISRISQVKLKGKKDQSFYSKVEQNTLESGSKIREMAMAHKYGLMELNTQVKPIFSIIYLLNRRMEK